MNLLVVSDTHGKSARLKEAVERTRAGQLLFLGDGLRDLSAVEESTTVYAVKGNCDWTLLCDAPESRMEYFEGKRIFMTHGHKYGVKGGTDALIAAAIEQDADVVLYGHTHQKEERWLPTGTVFGEKKTKKPLLIVNPGSLGEPREGAPSFVTLEIRNGNILAGFGEL